MNNMKRDLSNWWYYYKYYVIVGILLLVCLIRLIAAQTGLFQKKPDLQVAYVGKLPLPDDTAAALKEAFTAAAGDYNRDGMVLVEIHQYVSGNTDFQGTDISEQARYEGASELMLAGDINDCDSYFFLMESPDQFQTEWHILAAPDGSCPDPTDYETGDKTIRFDQLRSFQNMDLGTYTSSLLNITVSGDNREVLDHLYLGRRCFYTTKKTPNSTELDQLWKELI
ncbi:MAG: hypothetical protein IJ860_08815 [Eubacterium sp.]|nr:hypothetical protein [Eubacterium sp.]